MKRSALLLIVLLAAACRTATPPGPVGGGPPRLLRVSLFPYIPDPGHDDFHALIAGLTTRFKLLHPDIDLELTMNVADDPYDSDVQKRLFSANGPNAVEVDTLTLGDLVTQQYIAPLAWEEATIPFAKTAARIGGTQYAIPTWVCMTFMYQKAPAADDRVSGIWSGSWTLPPLYLVAYTDHYGYVPLEPVLHSPVDTIVVGEMAQVMAKCTLDTTNDCLNGKFASGAAGLPQKEYVQNKYASTTGFSESSFYIFANGGIQPARVEPMLLAHGKNRPLAFTDGLTLNAKSCRGTCVDDVKAFARFLNSPTIRSYIAFSEDAPGAPARNLSPASSSFWQEARVRNDWMYQQFAKGFDGAQGFPNQGFPAARKTLQKEICTELKKTIADACAP